MSRQYFMDLLCEPPIANQTAVTATTETGLWNVSLYRPIFANTARPGMVWRLTAGGIMSFAATGTLTITPRYGTTTSGITMGANTTAITTPGATTAHSWTLDFYCVCRTVGAPGTNSTVTGHGTFVTGVPAAAAGQSVAFAIGGTTATVDVSVNSGIFIGWTLSVAGTCTPMYAYTQSLN